MFFKDLSKWSKQKLRGLNILFGLLHFTALVLIPVVIVAINYKLFEKVDGFQLTATGIIVVIILGLYSYIKLKKVIDGLPQVKLSQQKFKFSFQTLLGLMPLAIVLFALEITKTNYLIAINCIKWCSISFVGALLIDGLFLKYIDQEVALRTKTLELVEIEKRKGLV